MAEINNGSDKIEDDANQKNVLGTNTLILKAINSRVKAINFRETYTSILKIINYRKIITLVRRKTARCVKINNRSR